MVYNKTVVLDHQCMLTLILIWCNYQAKCLYSTSSQITYRVGVTIMRQQVLWDASLYCREFLNTIPPCVATLFSAWFWFSYFLQFWFWCLITHHVSNNWLFFMLCIFYVMYKYIVISWILRLMHSIYGRVYILQVSVSGII